jgi:hypothetical protein
VSQDPRKLLELNRGDKQLMMTVVDDIVCIGVYSKEPGDDASTGEFINLDRAQWPLLAIAIAELTRDGDPLPKHEHATCATKYLLAERTVRIVEGLARGGKSIDSEMLETIDTLVDIAGVQMAREALSEPVPF